MLNHNLVQTWIKHKLRDVVPDLIIYLLLYLLFLANLTTYSLLLPRPGPWNENCELIHALLRVTVVGLCVCLSVCLSGLNLLLQASRATRYYTYVFLTLNARFNMCGVRYKRTGRNL